MSQTPGWREVCPDHLGEPTRVRDQLWNLCLSHRQGKPLPSQGGKVYSTDKNLFSPYLREIPTE